MGRQLWCCVWKTCLLMCEEEIVPFWHAEELVQNCRKESVYPPYWVENGGHNNLESVARCQDF
eukprot:4294424-Amphidinium_carterae.1